MPVSAPNATISPSPDPGSAVGAKVACCLILLISTFLLVFLPLWVWRCLGKAPSRRRFACFQTSLRQHALSALNCLAGGVFLGTALLHILADAQEEVQEGLEASNVKTNFPVANAFVLAGVVLIMGFEQLASYFEERYRFGSEEESQNLLPGSDQHSMRISNQTREVRGVPPMSAAVSSVILALAVSVHSIFEGLAIGLQPTSSAVFSLLFAVSFHKLVVTISLGLQLAQVKGALCLPVLVGTIYSCAAPFGVLIGALVSGSADSLTVGILQSLACGTFIYIAAFELLPEELRVARRNRTLCVAAFGAGIALVIFINVLFPHEHEHGHEHGHEHH